MHISFFLLFLFTYCNGQSTTTIAPVVPQCSCNFSTVWVDVVVVLDSSQASTSIGFAEMWGLATQFLGRLTIQKSDYTNSTFVSRLGVVTYGNTATVVSPLGTITNNDVASTIHPAYSGDALTNMASGIQAAVSQLNGPNHRSNAIKVIIIMAAQYNPSGVTDPTSIASSFKQSGGIIITYNYQLDDGTVLHLPDIATTGYAMASWQYSPVDVAHALCDGCYLPIETLANYKVASLKCQSTYNAVLSKDETADKTSFLSNIFRTPGSPFVIGLTYDQVDRIWKWDDGTTPGSYQPWVGGSPSVGNGLDCVYVTSNLQWQQTDCRNGFVYACEKQACDSLNYCS